MPQGSWRGDLDGELMYLSTEMIHHRYDFVDDGATSRPQNL